MSTQTLPLTDIRTALFQFWFSNAKDLPAHADFLDSPEGERSSHSYDSVRPVISSVRPVVFEFEVLSMLYQGGWHLLHAHAYAREVQRKSGPSVMRYVANYSFSQQTEGQSFASQVEYDEFQNLLLRNAYLTKVFLNPNGVCSVVLGGKEPLYEGQAPRMVWAKTTPRVQIPFHETLGKIRAEGAFLTLK